MIRRVNHDAQRRLTTEPTALAAELAKAADLLSRLSVLAVDSRLFALAGVWDGDLHLGSLDTQHLVAALELRPALRLLVSYDKALVRAATAAGITVAQPS